MTYEWLGAHSINMGGSIFEMFYFYFAHLSEKTMPWIISLTNRQSAVFHHSSTDIHLLCRETERFSGIAPLWHWLWCNLSYLM